MTERTQKFSTTFISVFYPLFTTAVIFMALTTNTVLQPKLKSTMLQDIFLK